ncbi:MAG: NAD(P)H-hydrate dehydratase [Acidobacteria bacterium]|nr:MAG: NAD(P)H-hydrate dehydratase [Acidobacteriota bacterium]
MIAVLDSPAMREADRVTIAELGLPSLVLMESAAAAVADLVAERFPGAGRIAVACGPGNNGGDGLAMARLLRCRGFDVSVGMLVARRSLKGDAAVQLELARRFGVPVSDCSRGGTARLAELLGGADVVVDALFGTGLDRPLTGRWAEAVSVVNRAGVPVVAVDLPSGLLGSSAGAEGPSVRADLTVTFAAPKVAHVLPPACWRCGEVAVAAIGIPPWVADARMSLGLVEAEDVAGWLPRRGPDAYKGTFGHLLVVAGREGRAGAAALAARAAVRMGAGLVTVATTGAAGAAVQALVPEAMVDVLEAGKGGEVAGGGIEGSLAKATAVAVGPGLGTGDGPRRLLGSILERWRGPLLLDADALTLLAGRLGTLRTRAVTPVLTPHPGELARLLGVATSEVTADRLGAACRAAEAGGAVVLAKGARTVIAGGGGVALVNPTGTSGLASGGAGDVLSGVVGALLAQGLAAREAAASGAYLHGRAAELAGERFPGAVPAGELVGYLAAAEAEVGQAG